MPASNYQCCFCGTGIATLGDDPVEITVRTGRDQEASQKLWSHALCLHRRVHSSVPVNLALLDELEDIPLALALQSASPNEIVLPYDEAVLAVDALVAANRRILGWEGWILTADGRVGHGDAPQGTEDLSHLVGQDAAELCRRTMREASDAWNGSSTYPGAKLLFCITVAAR
jgi:hypothetical protein